MMKTMNRRSNSLGYVLVAIVVVMVVCVLTGLLSGMVNRVDPGRVGVLIDYAKGSSSGKPSIEPVAPGQWKIVWVTQRLAEYDMSQQSLIMVRSEAEGQVIGDDSIACRDITGVSVNIDATVLWRIDTTNVGPLYLLYPDKDLANIGQEVVRRITREKVANICGVYGYADIYGAKRIEFGQQVAEALLPALQETYIIMAEFSMGEIWLQPDQQKAITAKSVAEQAAQQAAFLAQQRKNEAAAAVAQAEGDKKVKILQAQAQAEAIRIINEQLSNSPYYIKYVYASSWNGVLPTTLVLANGQEFPLIGTLDLQEAGATPIPVIPTPTPTVVPTPTSTP